MLLYLKMARRKLPSEQVSKQAMNKSEWTAMELPVLQLDAKGEV
jgi:hypothetical protein